ncbi:MAG TPA: hypothetical protein VFZ61_11170, partial [Polyangiales bacterium]
MLFVKAWTLAASWRRAALQAAGPTSGRVAKAMFAPYTWRVVRSKEPGALSVAPSETKVEGKGGKYHHGDLRRALLDA